jgi:hypothetical protein
MSERDEELSRIYRDAEGPRPPQRVDDNIVAASQRVAGARPRPAGVRFARRWGTPFALAATVVVTFTLTLMVFERESGLDTMAPKAPRAVRPAKISPAEPKRADQPVTPPPEKLQPIAPAPAVPPAAVRRDQVEQRPGERAASGARPGTGQPVPVPDAPRAAEVLRKSEGAAPAPAAPMSDALSAPELRQQARPTQVPAAAPAAGALSESAATLQDASVAALAASRLAVPDAKERTPEKWLEDIRKLKTDGKAAEAERELAEFKKRYPDYRLPEDLR